MGKADISTKKVINIYNQAWAKWVLQEHPIEVEAELSGEFQFVGRATDSLLKVKSEQGQFLVLTELQLYYDDTMLQRLVAYKALAQLKYSLNVFATVVYFFPPQKKGEEVASHYRDKFMGQELRADFQVIKLWELDANDVLAFDQVPLLPFLPLMKGGDDEQLLRHCLGRIRQEKDALELETILATFASYVFSPTILQQIMRWNMYAIQQSPLMQEFMAQSRLEGRVEGEQKGRMESMLTTLRQTLTIRFKANWDELAARLAPLSFNTLNQLFEVALTATHLSEFEQALTTILSQQPIKSTVDELPQVE